MAIFQPMDMAVAYVLGFSLGWTVFKPLFMPNMIGGSYLTSLRKPLIVKFLSMNALMAAMLPAAAFGRHAIATMPTPRIPEF